MYDISADHQMITSVCRWPPNLLHSSCQIFEITAAFDHADLMPSQV